MVTLNGRVMDTLDMQFAGPSRFQTEAVVRKKGDYELIVYAFDPVTGNAGVDKLSVNVQ